MSVSEGHKTKLSKNIRQMKFMQRSVILAEKEEEKQRIVDDEHWVLDIPELKQKESKFQFEPSHTVCENLRFGRMSFKGFNKEIEKIMRIHDSEFELSNAEEKEKEMAVSDEEMAERYQNLVNTIGKKFQKKRQRSTPVSEEEEEGESGKRDPNQQKQKKKRKFLRPE